MKRTPRRLVLGAAWILACGSAAQEPSCDGTVLPEMSWGNVAGSVVDGWGAPLGDLAVRIHGSRFDTVTRTDASGRFLFSGLRVPFDGDTALVVVESDLHIPPAVVVVPPGAILAPELRFAPGTWFPETVSGTEDPVQTPFAARTTAAAVPWKGPWTVFATREGLVGFTTANGHVITAADRFVALPSRRALNATDTSRDYLVELTNGSRSTIVPVLDVGPWNTRDDWWHDTLRETFGDLERGLPEAMAAFRDGYNGGLDGSGRKVLNGAGIDLADGVFWDDLSMVNNGPVSVRLLWKLDAAVGDRVRLRQWANVRDGAAGTLLFRADCGESGTVTGPPAGGVSGGRWYLYWPVAWDRGATGWVVENFLTRDTASVACANLGTRPAAHGFDARPVAGGVLVRSDAPRAVTIETTGPSGRILSRSTGTAGPGATRFDLEPARGLELVSIRIGDERLVLRRMP